MNILTSRGNDNIKKAVKLRTDRDERTATGLFFIEGVRLYRDAVQSGIGVVSLFVTEKAMEKYDTEIKEISDAARESFLITEEISEKLSDTKSPQGVFCICKILDKNHNIDKINYNGIYAAFEEIQTPGNLGAAARTAEALGLDGLIVSGGCDIYNPKAQRAAMGSLLRLDVIRTENLTEILMKCSEKGMKTYAAVPDKNALPVTEIDKSGGIIAVIGNEGNGLTDETIKTCSGKITIPMQGRAESLNAGAAASIIMWEMVR